MSNSYLYWPVAGASLFWREPCGIKKAKAALPELRKKWSDVEIERVLLLDNNARRYWRWRGGKWDAFKWLDDPTEADLRKWRP